MKYEEKKSEYLKLIEDIKTCPLQSACSKNESEIILHQCSACNEVNMWSYWQGGIDCLDADIMIVGKDWGPCDDYIAKQYIHGYTHLPYPPAADGNTDDNLCKLMLKGLGIDIRNQKHSNVFFTNFILCYRMPNTSSNGGFACGNRKDIQVLKNCSEYFIRLVNIISPKIIVCLGIPPYKGVSLCTAQTTSPFREAVGFPPQKIRIGNIESLLFAVEHCGSRGSWNRSYNDPTIKKGDKKLGWQLMENDWISISEYI